MTDACTVKYQTGTALNETTGLDVPTYTQRFASACKVQARDLVANDSNVGGHVATTVKLSVHLPVSAGEVSTDELITITASVHDAQLVGRVFRATAPVGKSFATARRVDVSEVIA